LARRRETGVEANLSNPFKHLSFVITGEEELVVVVLGMRMILPGKSEGVFAFTFEERLANSMVDVNWWDAGMV
jgi:hypothetical protein